MKKVFAILTLVLFSQLSYATPEECVDQHFSDWINEYGNIKGISEEQIKEWEDECGLIYDTPENNYTLSLGGNITFNPTTYNNMIKLINKGDTLNVIGYTVNRGTCFRKDRLFGGPQKLRFGETMNLQYRSDCELLEVKVVTDVGEFEWTFN